MVTALSFTRCYAMPYGAINMGYTAHFVHPKNCYAIPSHIPVIIGNFKNPLVSREQLNKQRATI